MIVCIYIWIKRILNCLFFPTRKIIQDTFRVLNSFYKNGELFRGRKVLVVGFGNSGGEIAIDLWEHAAQVGFAVRGAVNVIPRELFGIAILSIGILQSKLPSHIADTINAPFYASQ